MYKKIILFAFIAIFSCTIAAAQDVEPEFIGEVNLVKDNSNPVLLDKETVKIKTKAGASLYIVGIGSVKSRITIETPQASVRAKANEPFSLIIRCVDNASDPLAVISIFQFDKKGKQRRAEISSSNTFGGVSEGNMKMVKYTAKKFGTSSYKVTINQPVAGEYGIMVKNPNNRDEKSVIVACYGLD